MQTLVVFLIRGYQLTFSSWLAPRCRFMPSCSDYALDAIKKYGLYKGLKLAIRRLLRCHPWAQSGIDPVP